MIPGMRGTLLAQTGKICRGLEGPHQRPYPEVWGPQSQGELRRDRVVQLQPGRRVSGWPVAHPEIKADVGMMLKW